MCFSTLCHHKQMSSLSPRSLFSLWCHLCMAENSPLKAVGLGCCLCGWLCVSLKAFLSSYWAGSPFHVKHLFSEHVQFDTCHFLWPPWSFLWLFPLRRLCDTSGCWFRCFGRGCLTASLLWGKVWSIWQDRSVMKGMYAIRLWCTYNPG